MPCAAIGRPLRCARMEAKCGRCGAQLTSFDGACPSCGAAGAPRSARTALVDGLELTATSETVATPAPPPGSAAHNLQSGPPPKVLPKTEVAEDPLLGSIPVDPKDGKVLGGVKIVRRLGAGGMGAVYVGHHLVLETTVAVKILPGHLAADESYEERFKREARLSFEVVHANIVRTLHAGKEHGLYFIQMEFVDGTSAGELVRTKGRLSEAQALQICRDATLGLAEAHRRGIVHRDVKPDNILVRREDGTAKIADLGLARVHQAAKTAPVITGAGQTLGTPAYMAPEQIEDASHVGPPADIYSIGASLFELLCGRPPFASQTIPSLFREILEHPAPDALDFRPGLSPAVREIIRRCLEKKPAQRYAQAGDLAQALEAALPGASRETPQPVRHPGAPAAPGRWGGRGGPEGAAPHESGDSSKLTETYHAPSSAPTVAPQPQSIVDYRTRKRIWAAFAFTVLAALAGGFYIGTRAPGPPEKKVLLYGVLPDRRLTTERLKALEPVTKFLEASARRNFEPWVGVSYDDNIDAFIAGKLALAQFGGASYVLLKERMPEAIPLFQRNVDQKFQSIFIVSSASECHKLEDLKGKEIAFVDELSTAGYVVPAIELLEKGIDPAKDIRVKFLHAHDTVVRDVADGSAVAGVLDARVMDTLVLDGKLDRRAVRTVHTSAPFPDDVWVASPSLEPKIRQRILEAFLALDPARGADVATLSALASRQYTKAEDGSYDDLRRKIKLLQARGLLRK